MLLQTELPTEPYAACATRHALYRYVTQCYSNYFTEKTWSRRPFSVLKSTFDNATGPEECRNMANGDYSDARIIAGDKEYDKYQICLGKAYYRQWEVVDPETGKSNITDPLKLAFTWRRARENDLADTYRFLGRFATYDGSGFVFDLDNLTTYNLVNAFNYFEENIWLDRETRAIYISVTVYNANLNTYAVCNFNIELSLAGVLVPRYSISSVDMDLFASWNDSGENTFKLVSMSRLPAGSPYCSFPLTFSYSPSPTY